MWSEPSGAVQGCRVQVGGQRHTEGVSLTMGHSHSLRRLAHISQSLCLTEEIKAISLWLYHKTVLQ